MTKKYTTWMQMSTPSVTKIPTAPNAILMAVRMPRVIRATSKP